MTPAIIEGIISALLTAAPGLFNLLTQARSGATVTVAQVTAELADFNWLVSIQSFTLVPSKDGALSMDAIVRTLRPLNMLPNANDAKVSP